MIVRCSCVFLLVLLALPICGIGGEPRSDVLGDPLPPGAIARLGTVRLRQGGSIEHLMFSPDGKRLVSWGGAHFVSEGIAIWEVGTGKELRRVPRLGAQLAACAWLADGRGIAVTESFDRHSLCDFSAATVEWQGFPEKDNTHGARFAVARAGNVLAVTQDGRDGRGYAVEFRELTPNKTARELKVLRVGQATLEYTTILKFTPDGRTLIAFTPSRMSGWIAVLWDVATATERRRLTLPDTAFRGSGETVVSSNERLGVGLPDGSVRLYDLASGKEQKLSDCHKAGDPLTGTGGVTATAFDQDGSTLVTGGDDGRIRQWDVTSGKMRREFAWSRGRVGVMVVSPDGKVLALGGFDGVIRLLDATTGAETCPQPGHQGGVLKVVVSADGRTAVTVGLDQTLRIWDLAGAREVRQIAPGGFIANCVLSPDAKTVVAGVHLADGPGDGPLRVWSVTDGQEGRPAPGMAGAAARSVRLAADARTLFTLHGDKLAVRSWPSGELQREITLPQPRSKGFSVLGGILATSSDGKLVVTTAMHVSLWHGRILDAEGGSLDLWDAISGKHLRQLAPTGDSSDLAVFTPAGELLVATDADIPGAAQGVDPGPQGALHVVDVRTGKAARTFALPIFRVVDGQRFVTALAVSPDGRTAYVGGRDGTIHVCEVATGRTRHRLAGHRDRVTDLAVAADGQRLMSASLDATVLVWDLSVPAAPPR